jgi:hypothetical protein
MESLSQDKENDIGTCRYCMSVKYKIVFCLQVHHLLESSEEDEEKEHEEEIKFLKSLSTKQKQKLLK